MEQSRLPAGLLLASLAVCLVVTFSSLPGTSLLIKEIQDTLHTLLFGVFTFTALWLLRRRATHKFNPAYSYLLVISACVTTGVAAEAGQWLIGRRFGIIDIVRDIAGIAIATGLFALLDKTAADARLIRSVVSRTGITFLLCLTLLASAYPLGLLVWHYIGRNSAYPVIMDLQADWAGSFTRLQATHINLDSEVCAPTMVPLNLTQVRYPGASVIEPVADWRGHTHLAIELQPADATAVEIELRIHDRTHNNELNDRFNHTLMVQPGTHRYLIPLELIRNGPIGRELDLARVAELKLFSSTRPHPETICVGRMQLEK